MKKIDKHTGLYLVYEPDYVVGHDPYIEESAPLDDLAFRINDYLLTRSLSFRNKVRRGVLSTLPPNYNAETPLWDLVIAYPETALKIIESMKFFGPDAGKSYAGSLNLESTNSVAELSNFVKAKVEQYATPYEQHIMSNTGLSVVIRQSTEEAPEDSVTSRVLDLFDSVRSKEVLKEIFEVAGLSFDKYDHSYNREQIKWYPHKFVKAYQLINFEKPI